LNSVRQIDGAVSGECLSFQKPFKSQLSPLLSPSPPSLSS
jgi:hypothetical protein